MNEITYTSSFTDPTALDAMAKDVLHVLKTSHEPTSILWGERRLMMSISEVTSEEIQAINKEWRQQDKATNVLSFPAVSPSANEQTPILLGDLVICRTVAEQEAKKEGITLNIHLQRLVIHGILHLLGYDHQTPQEATDMAHWEEKILEVLKISGLSLVRESGRMEPIHHA